MGRAVLIWLAQRTPPVAGRQMSSSKPTASGPGIDDADERVGALAGPQESRDAGARQVVRRPDVAHAQRPAEAVLEHEPKQRERLGVGRAVDDACAQHEPIRPRSGRWPRPTGAVHRPKGRSAPGPTGRRTHRRPRPRGRGPGSGRARCAGCGPPAAAGGTRAPRRRRPRASAATGSRATRRVRRPPPRPRAPQPPRRGACASRRGSGCAAPCGRSPSAASALAVAAQAAARRQRVGGTGSAAGSAAAVARCPGSTVSSTMDSTTGPRLVTFVLFVEHQDRVLVGAVEVDDGLQPRERRRLLSGSKGSTPGFSTTNRRSRSAASP